MVQRIARYGQLLDSLQLFQQFPLLAFDQAADDEFRRLQSLRLRRARRTTSPIPQFRGWAVRYVRLR